MRECHRCYLMSDFKDIFCTYLFADQMLSLAPFLIRILIYVCCTDEFGSHYVICGADPRQVATANRWPQESWDIPKCHGTTSRVMKSNPLRQINIGLH